ncbi:MAG: mechanosensitive ion channel domain-containing protein, partial [Bdellovibrionota bacterium]
LRKVIFFVVDNIKKFTDKSQTDWDDKIIEASEYTLGSIAACLFWFLSIRVMNLEGNSFLILDVILKVLLSFFVIKLAYQLVDVFTSYLGTKAAETDFPLDDQLVPLIRKSLRIFTVIFGALIAVQNLGVNVMSVLAGLGLGGLAFALAAKDACANLFGSFMILLDKPFRVGDHIVFNGVEGSVEEIGFRSTKIRSFYGSQISVPNSSLANVNIDNMGRRKTRRLRTTLGLTYDTSPAQMEAFLEGLKNIIRANPYTVKQGFNIAFSEYGDFSLNVLINVFLDVPDHGMELLQKQNIFLEAMRLAEDIGVEFAFPTQSLYLQNQEPIAAKVVNDEEYSTLAKSYGPDGSKAMPKGKGLFTPAFMD